MKYICLVLLVWRYFGPLLQKVWMSGPMNGRRWGQINSINLFLTPSFSFHRIVSEVSGFMKVWSAAIWKSPQKRLNRSMLWQYRGDECKTASAWLCLLPDECMNICLQQMYTRLVSKTKTLSHHGAISAKGKALVRNQRFMHCVWFSCI